MFEDGEDNVEDIDLETFGKKKKKKKRPELDMDDLKDALPDDNKENDDVNIEDDLDLESFGDKKKKKKKKKPKDLDDLIAEDEDKENEDANPWMDSDRDYTYE